MDKAEYRVGEKRDRGCKWLNDGDNTYSESKGLGEQERHMGDVKGFQG